MASPEWTEWPPSMNGMGRVLAQNIQALVALRQQAEKRKGWQERAADRVTAFAGSMPFVYLHAVLVGGWVAWNLGAVPDLTPFDPTFVVLAMIASVESIFLSTFILISQNRMQAAADKRAELDLQIGLLSEHEVTRLVTLVDAIADKLGVARPADADIEEAKQDVDPAAVFRALEDQAPNGPEHVD